SMRELVADLRWLARQSQDSIPAYRGRFARTGQQMLVVAGSVVLLAVLVTWLIRARADPESLRAVPLLSETGVARYPSISPEGNHVVFAWTGPKQNNPDLYVQQIGSGRPLRLTTDPANDYNPVWSPDGKWIAFLRSKTETGRSEVKLIPPLG